MDSSLAMFELVLRGIAVGALAVTAAGIWRGDVGRNVRWAGLLCCVAIIGFALNDGSPALRKALGPAAVFTFILACGATGFIWQFVLVVFEDRPISLWTLAPAAALTVSSLYGRTTHCNEAHPIWLVRDALSIALAAHALWVIGQGWRGDLVEARRRLRGPFLGIVSGYIIIETVVEAIARQGVPMPWRNLSTAIALTLLTLTGALVFLDARRAVFGAMKREVAPGQPSIADTATLQRLLAWMDEEQGWRRESLTIGAVAAAVGAPEHRLRRLINDNLGHRNFAAFVNARRIEAAKRALIEPDEARTSIATIAFDHGFASLGPFNRAFKASTGLSPRQWRRQAVGDAAEA